jgi:hypothetical protein
MNNEKTITAVDYAVQDLLELFLDMVKNIDTYAPDKFSETRADIVERAKVIEKAQIVNAWNDGNFLGRNPNILADYDTGEQYFNQTHKKD